MPEWIEAGKAAVPCTCSCLPDGVALDMGIFCPELREEQSSGEPASSSSCFCVVVCVGEGGVS